MEVLLKKNAAAYLIFPMVDSTTPANYKAGETVADEAYYKDDAGAWTSLAISDSVTEIGATGLYALALTAAELNHDQIIIKLTAADSSDQSIVIRTTVVTDILDATMGDKVLDYDADTLTYFREDGVTELKVFDGTESSDDAKSYTEIRGQ